MPRISLDGQFVDAEAGDTVAEALLRSRITTFSRSIKYHRPRGPFCFSGSCGQCLMEIDGLPSQLACRVRAEEGMRCRRQNAPLGAETDLLRAADFVFADGLDHHHLLTGSRILGRVALEVARRLAGLGELPAAPQPIAAGEVRCVRLAIIGAGPSGLSAARAAGSDAVCIEREARPGGAAQLGLPGSPDAAWLAQPVPGELICEAECVGLYANDTALPGNALVVVRRKRRLLVLAAQKVIVATGGAPQPLAFAGCDRPGVYAARGLLSLRGRVGDRLVVIGSTPASPATDGARRTQHMADELRDCAEALRRKGYEVVREVGRTDGLRALGKPVRAVQIGGERVRCDAVAIAAGPAPLHELATSVGAHARWDAALGGFPVQVDERGQTSIPWLFAAGRVCGQGAARAVASGEAAGTACRA